MSADRAEAAASGAPAAFDAPAATRASRWPFWFAGVLLAIALLGPVLANDVPVVARIGGHWQFPAVADLVASPPPGPGDQTWKQWWARLDPGSPDFGWMPPWPYGPVQTDLELALATPTFAHPFGNDSTGRDVLARIVAGTRAALLPAICGVAAAALLGVLLGAVAGFRRGFVDVLVLRLVELMMCFPTLLLLFAVAALFGDTWLGIVVVFAATMWPSFARIVRGELLALRERDFVQVARGLGVRESRILFAHLLPQLRGQIAVTAAFCVAQGIVAESTLAFLGIGPGDRAGSWGGILAQGRANAHLGAWHLWFFPAAAIVCAVICCHALADRFRR